MEKEFIVFYESAEYGYLTTEIDADNISSALQYFLENYSHEKVYGIMEKK